MALERVDVEGTVVAWARQTAGHTEESAAHRLGVGLHTLRGWESGEIHPTVGQLRRAAKLYRRPLAVMLLTEAPREFDALHDFRLVDQVADWSPALHSEFKRALTQREVFLELAEFAPGALVPDAFDVVVQLPSDPEEAARSIRDRIGIQQFAWADPRDALNAWLQAVEGVGIVVMQTAGVAVAEMRGFSISSEPQRVIALNGSDSPRARLFTLAHELAHIAINAGGLCLLNEPREIRSPDETTEHFCNDVAASILMPRDAVLGVGIVAEATRDKEWTLGELAALSRRFGTSSEAMLLRLVALHKATWETYWLRKPELEAEYARARETERQRQRDAEGGPSYYVVKARNLGHGYVRSVLDAFRARGISSLDLTDYLDIRFDQVRSLEEALR